MNNHYENVCELMNTAGQGVFKSISISSLRNPKITSLRYNIILEEVKNELFKFFEHKNLIEVVDAIGDTLVVTYGAYAAFGLMPYDKESFEYKNFDTKNKPSMPTRKSFYFIRKSLIKSIYIFKKNTLDVKKEKEFNVDKIKESLDNICFLMYLLSSIMHLDIDAVFSEIHNSNMSKFLKTHEDAKLTIDKLIKKGKFESEEELLIEQKNGLFVVKRKSDGKFLKGINFFEPDIKKFV